MNGGRFTPYASETSRPYEFIHMGRFGPTPGANVIK